MSDWQLLSEYAAQKSETAFRRLVDKYLDLVYWTCRRNVRDAQTAEDAAQMVFLLLARKANDICKVSSGAVGTRVGEVSGQAEAGGQAPRSVIPLRGGVSISGWLYNTARLVARNAARQEARIRITDEVAAHITQGVGMDSASSTSMSPDIEALLDEAIASLPSADRDVILLRFYDRLSYQEIAREVGATENTVTKRVGRAIDKMRRHFEQRRVTVSSAGLGSLMTRTMVKPAPETCRTALSHTVHGIAAGHSTAAGHASLIQKGLDITMQATKYKVIIAGTAALLAIGIIAIPVYLKARQATALSTVTVNTAPAVSSSNVGNTAALAEVEQDVRDLCDRQLLLGDHTRPAYVARDFSTTYGGQTTSYNTDAAYAQYIDHACLTTGQVQFEKPAVCIVVTSFHMNGNTAALGWHIDVSGTVRPWGRPPYPGPLWILNFAGWNASFSQDGETDLGQVSGRWIIEHENDGDVSPLTVRKDGQYATVTADAHGNMIVTSKSPGMVVPPISGS